IYTVTLNPAIDYIVRLTHIESSAVNRMDSSDTFAGGKGINVSRILQRLGYASTATGFVGGFTGEFIKNGLVAEAIGTKFVQVDQDTRINVKIKADQETEINGLGPVVTDEQLAELEDILSHVTADDTV
ncbi:1-phosphofructokinase, partial [Gemella sp. 19428wG2_WT2a]